MYDFENFHQATSVEDAIAALNADPTAIIISGGSDVLVQIREGKLAGSNLVSIQGIPALSGVSLQQDGTILIRPGTTFSQVTENEIIQTHIPTLGMATDTAGGPQLRNIGTIGGNVCNGVTSADSATSLLTLNAQLEITSATGIRHQSLAEFYTGPGRVNLAHGEIVTGICIAKKDYAGFGGHYIKFAQRNAMDICTIGCAVHVKLSADKNAIEEMRLALGVAGPVPARCPKTEAAAAGQLIQPALFNTLSQTVLGEVAPRDSWRASKVFRQQLISEGSARALKQAIINAGGAAV